MRQPLNKDIALKLILLWIGINSLIGMLLAALFSVAMNTPFANLVWPVLLATHCIAIPATLAGYGTGYLFSNKPVWIIIPATTLASGTFAFAGIQLSLLLGSLLSGIIDYQLMTNIMNKMTLPVMILSVLVNTAATIIELYKYNRMLLVKSLNEMENKIARIETLAKRESGLSFKEKDSFYEVEYDDIIYLSSSGKKSLVHTEERDYEISELMKEVEEKLPEELFIRIHKQYIINRSYVTRMQYYKGGRYILYLNDEDENVLPVGGIYTTLLKESLGM
ncbi:MAG: LytTR family transcriptional regulator [bacterium]|nr:LytTR family transcriptional regulator [bacterium]